MAPHRLSSSPSPVLDPKRLESALQENGVPMDASEGPVRSFTQGLDIFVCILFIFIFIPSYIWMLDDGWPQSG